MATLKNIRKVFVWFITKGRTRQEFLGAHWIDLLLKLTPPQKKQKTALKVLSLSPHYFFRNKYPLSLPTSKFLELEHQRNALTRKNICDKILAPQYLNESFTVLDYGCGAGYLAKEVSGHVRKGFACDISRGVISCAKILNPAKNIKYFVIGQGTVIPIEKSSLDLIYSFAVIQHVTDTVFESILKLWFAWLRPGGIAVVHLVLNADDWHTEAEWHQDRSISGRIKFEFGLNCFKRSPRVVSQMVSQAGFNSPKIIPVNELGNTSGECQDDVFRQHLCVFTKPQ